MSVRQQCYRGYRVVHHNIVKGLGMRTHTHSADTVMTPNPPPELTQKTAASLESLVPLKVSFSSWGFFIATVSGFPDI